MKLYSSAKCIHCSTVCVCSLCDSRLQRCYLLCTTFKKKHFVDSFWNLFWFFDFFNIIILKNVFLYIILADRTLRARFWIKSSFVKLISQNCSNTYFSKIFMYFFKFYCQSFKNIHFSNIRFVSKQKYTHL